MNDENIKKRLPIMYFVFITVILMFIIIYPLRCPGPLKEQSKNVVCRSNLKQLGIAFYMYATDNSNTYPTPEKWCDLIRPYLGRGNNDKLFQCPAAEKAACHYAMNPNCEPNSPPDTVLLFETKGGWNLFGGPELLTTNNHSNTCNVCYKDGSVGRITKEEIPNLNW
jgi:hypothetical protein